MFRSIKQNSFEKAYQASTQEGFYWLFMALDFAFSCVVYICDIHGDVGTNINDENGSKR